MTGKISQTLRTLKAAVYKQYGPPEVVTLAEVDKPMPGSGEVLVKVHASTVNRTDCGFRSAEYFVSRFWSGLLKPKFKSLGCEFAGEIEELGPNVGSFKKGDRVFGFNDASFGGHAEYLVISESAGLAHIPAGVSFENAAPIAEGAHYALCNIRASKIVAGQNALVYGATGAIGSAAVQLLKHMGVKVTAVCNTKNIDLVKSLGADQVIDYQTQDFTKTPTRFYLVFDAVGKSSFGTCKPLMEEKSVYVSTELGKNGQNIFLALAAPVSGGKKVIFPIPYTKKEDIEHLAKLVELGHFKPVIDRSYPLKKVVEAYHYVESGQKTGNVVLTIS